MTQVAHPIIVKKPLKHRADPGQLFCTELLKIKGEKLEL